MDTDTRRTTSHRKARRQLPLWAGLAGCVALSLAGLSWSNPFRRAGATAGWTAEMLRNGDFEEKQPTGWTIRGSVIEGGGRSGSRAFVCEARKDGSDGGASQTLVLQRNVTTVFRVRGWSRAENVSGTQDEGYSLHADMELDDGTMIFGQAVPFSCGSHDWERREMLVPVIRPVKTLTLHCLFRGHTGKAWFDDISVEETQPEAGAAIFQGAAVFMNPPRHAKESAPRAAATRDGLEATFQAGRISSLKVEGRELATPAPSGFLVRDVAAQSAFHPLANGACEALGLRLQSETTAQPDHLSISGRLFDTTRRDRALTLVFALPIDAAGWRWGEDIRRSVPIQGNHEYADLVTVPCGATGTMSRHPLAAISSERAGIAIAIDMARPAQFRLAYHAGTKQFLVAYDFGLLGDPEPSRAGAEFRFVIYRFDPRGGFRAAVGKMYSLFPDHFASRATEHGTWLPFLDAGKVREWRDFGFKYHEGADHLAYDDAHGLLSFRYSEPLARWMALPRDTPRTESAALLALAKGEMARAVESAGMTRQDGGKAMLFRSAPWCDGVVWSVNPNHVPQDRRGGDDPDGEFLDSIEGYVTTELDYHRDHLRAAGVPLSFSCDTRRPALFKGLAAFEYVKRLSEELRRNGKLAFGNGVPRRFAFLSPWLDVMGTEVDWFPEGQYRPTPDEEMVLWRTLSYQKPYHVLMNADFERLTPEHMERYFQRCLFYGIFPGMFSRNASDHSYWENPRWHDRDRALFKKYIPLIRRAAIAGWQPETRASCDNAGLYVERFGPDSLGTRYFTLMNDTDRPQSGKLTIELPPDSPSIRARELITGVNLETAGASLSVDLQARQVRLVEIQVEAPGR